MSPVLARIAFRNLRRNWRHSLASMLSIGIGFLAVCVFSGFIAEAVELFRDGTSRMAMLGHIVVEKAGAPEHYREDPPRYSLDERDQAAIDAFLERNRARVEVRMRSLSMAGMVSNGPVSTVFIGFGHDLEEGARLRGAAWAWNTQRGKPLYLQDLPEGIAVGEPLGRMIDCAATTNEDPASPTLGYLPKDRPFRCTNDRVQLQATTGEAQLNAVEAQVVAMANSGMVEFDDKWIVMPLELAWRLLDTRRISLYSILLRDEADVPAFMDELRRETAAKGIDLAIQTWWTHPLHGELYRRSIGLLGLFRTFLLTVVIFVGAMAVANTITRSVAERTREIGTLRSLGYLPRHVIEVFAWESFFLALVACVLGLVASLALTAVVNSSSLTWPEGIASYTMPLRIRLELRTALIATGGLTAVSVFAAWFPSRRAARMSIPDALGHV